jgi:dihydrofolate reductase
VPSWIFSSREQRPVEGADVRFVRGDVAPVHAELAEAAGERDVWIVGGGPLVAQFAAAGLLDEVLVTIAPVTLGAGRPLLPARVELRLEETGRNGDFVAARYAVVR